MEYFGVPNRLFGPFVLISCRRYAGILINDVTNVLSCRLQHLPELSDLWQRSLAERLQPYVGLWHALPDLPHPALIRTLQGHTDNVWGCAVSPDGTWIVSASVDKTLKVWDARTGICLITFPVEGFLVACTFHPDGKHLVAAGAGGVYFLEWVP